jgi:formylmethanofuran dehydrogenase subunit E
MAHVPPFHTSDPRYSAQRRAVYHECEECHEGRAIKPEHRESGTGGKHLCRECTNICSSM